MHIEIETEDLVADQLTSRKDGIVYYTLEQPALMFTDQSRYPTCSVAWVSAPYT